MPYLRRRCEALTSAPAISVGSLGDSLPQHDALRTLIASQRSMAARYRKSADQADAYQAEEYRQLAESSEQSANELDEILRQKGG